MAIDAPAVLAAPRGRLALWLLLAPALTWLLGLIVLPHVDLALLSLRPHCTHEREGHDER